MHVQPHTRATKSMHDALLPPVSLCWYLLFVPGFGGGAKGSTGRAATSQAQGASSGRSAFADATAAAAALPDEAAADYMQPKKPSRPVSEPGVLDGHQQPRGQGAQGSAKSLSSIGGTDRGAASQTHTPRGRRDQVLLKVSPYSDSSIQRHGRVWQPPLIATQSKSTTTNASLLNDILAVPNRVVEPSYHCACPACC